MKKLLLIMLVCVGCENHTPSEQYCKKPKVIFERLSDHKPMCAYYEQQTDSGLYGVWVGYGYNHDVHVEKLTTQSLNP